MEYDAVLKYMDSKLADDGTFLAIGEISEDKKGIFPDGEVIHTSSIKKFVTETDVENPPHNESILGYIVTLNSVYKLEVNSGRKLIARVLVGAL